MLNLPLSHEPDAPPLQEQLYQLVRAQIVQGQLPGGTQLPPSRALARAYGLARVTVTAAYNQLQAEGYVMARSGAGTFVVPLTPTPAVLHPALPRLTPWAQAALRSSADGELGPAGRRLEMDFGFGRSASHPFPFAIWRRLLARHLSSDESLLARYGSPAGFYRLRQALADYLARRRGVVCHPDQVVIVNGGQQALDILARLLLQPGDVALVETPGYQEAYELLQVYGAHLHGLPVDDDGLQVNRLPDPSPARLLFVTPAHQFPSGGAMPLARRQTLLEWAGANQVYVVEDDYDSELRYDVRPPAALHSLDRAQRVIYLGTFSKVLFPALRLAYVVLPPALAPAFLAAKRLIDRGSPTLTQAAIADFIVEGHFEKHLRRLRRTIGARRRALAAALEGYLPEGRYAPTAAGLHIMLYLPETVSEAWVVEQAAAAGVGVYPGAPYHVNRPARPSVLLGFSQIEPEAVEPGVQRLGAIVRAAIANAAAAAHTAPAPPPH